MLLEISISAVLLSGALVGIASVSHSLDKQSRLVGQRVFASEILQNQMETFATLTPDQRQQRLQMPVELPDMVRQKLPQARLTASVESLASEDQQQPTDRGQRLSLKLTWAATPDTEPTQLVLTTYFFDRPDGQPAEAVDE